MKIEIKSERLTISAEHEGDNGYFEDVTKFCQNMVFEFIKAYNGTQSELSNNALDPKSEEG